MNSSELQKLKSTWESLGRDDPLWAIVSHAEKQGGKWNLREFLETGEADVARIHAVLVAHGKAPQRLGQVLDFGCGVGRLSLAWSKRCHQVTGVDISSSMIEQGRVLTKDHPNVQLILNDRTDLSCFEDGRFDLIASQVCLQHMPWELAADYIREFARICSPDGIVVFQLPTRLLEPTWRPRIQKAIVDSLPFGLGRSYRRWRWGRDVAMEMYFTPRETVTKVASDAGLDLVHLESDLSAGAATEGFLYVFRTARR